jgi:hypothetical protein
VPPGPLTHDLAACPLSVESKVGPSSGPTALRTVQSG